MKEIINVTSQNGRWGLAIVSESEDVTWPARGKLISLGQVDGQDVFQFTPDSSGDWIHVIHNDVEPIAGCKIIKTCNLQGGQHITVLSGGDFFAYTKYGYMQRSSSTICFQDGKEVKVPASILLAMGIISGQEPKKVDTTPPTLESPLASALRKAGL